MTNVKLKLMFFLLSALLTADIVHARPYSDNNTDIVYNYNSNDTYLPVEANTDTLIVKYNEEEVSRKANNNMDAMMTAEQDRDDDLSKKVIAAQIKPEDHESHKQNVHLDEIITAEQDRDRELSKKINKDQSMLKVSRKDADSFEKQMNISSPFLEELIDSETDREETLTDILLRGRSDSFVEPPRFEFLIAAKINESELTNKSASGRNDNALDRGDKNSSDILRKVDYVELVEVLKPGGGKGENKSAYNLLNITANEVDNDLAPDTSSVVQYFINNTKAAYNEIRVQYNNAWRALHRLPYWCSASEMFAASRVPGWAALMRRTTAGASERIHSSTNSVVCAARSWLASPIHAAWRRLHED
ncbi:hypothetical protein NE865_16098 [Phthorimaea operculella]|nr:hypothetical protein NE865_16098 [Phthorimaea operculella]